MILKGAKHPCSKAVSHDRLVECVELNGVWGRLEADWVRQHPKCIDYVVSMAMGAYF
jgi:hypothetical protein